MSIVTKAFDLTDHIECAIKRMKVKPDELVPKESFHREQKALQELSEHPNIVRLLNLEIDESGAFLVLEWLPFNLADWIERDGPMPWEEYFSLIGRPILDAIVFAQSREWSHRDIKPANILLTANGIPKLSDYGIAKKQDRPSLGLTFAGFRSQPFTPPEDDVGGEWRFSRDCFSWAAVTVYCLTGEAPKDYGALNQALAGLNRTDVPVDILESALSHVPEERPILATALLADLDDWAEQRNRQSRKELLCHLRIESNCLRWVMATLETTDSRQVERHIEQELEEAFGIKTLEGRGLPAWRVAAATWIFNMVRPPSDPGHLLIVKASPARPAEMERYREASFHPPIRFTFQRAPEPERAASLLDDLFIDLAAFETAAIFDAKAANRERIFKRWYSFLHAKADYEARKESAIDYSDYSQNKSTITLTTDLPAPLEIIGQSRMIRLTSSSRIFCEVVDVNLDQVVVSVTSGDISALPRRGRLEVNTFAAERAIDRQRYALDAVNFDRAVSTRLKQLLVDPAQAPAPSHAPTAVIPDKRFDDEKKKAVNAALGLNGVLAIQGPPGTGKTRLIEEIIVQYAQRHPLHRILLSSQTHVALDNVLERVRKREPQINMVRIGKLNDAKVSESCRDLLLDRKAESWSKDVAKKATEFVARWAEDRGIKRSSIELGMLAERLIRLDEQLNAVKDLDSRARERAREIEERLDKKLDATGSTLSEELDSEVTEIQQSLGAAQVASGKLKELIAETRERLRAIDGYGAELAEGKADELKEWASLLLGESDDEKKCKAMLELQEDWLLRVGKSTDFHAAMLSAAEVVAGTCIGMAGVKGMTSVAYDLCIVDEASKATATEILVPMSRSKNWILVGDPEQLPPFFEEKAFVNIADFADDEIRETLLDRFLGGLPSHSIIRLKNQYRMVKPIGDLISEVFYGGDLRSPITKPEVVLTGAFTRPITWLSTANLHFRRETRIGQSYRNETECQAIKDTLGTINFIAKKRRHVYDVAVIAGYMAQVKALSEVIRDHLHEWTNLKIVCNTVDAFQGDEAELCVYSVTRSNAEGRLGFLREKPRLNVALSRGRSALIIVGDDEFCRSAENDNPFRKVLEFIDAHADSCELRSLK